MKVLSLLLVALPAAVNAWSTQCTSGKDYCGKSLKAMHYFTEYLNFVLETTQSVTGSDLNDYLFTCKPDGGVEFKEMCKVGCWEDGNECYKLPYFACYITEQPDYAVYRLQLSNGNGNAVPEFKVVCTDAAGRFCIKNSDINADYYVVTQDSAAILSSALGTLVSARFRHCLRVWITRLFWPRPVSTGILGSPYMNIPSFGINISTIPPTLTPYLLPSPFAVNINNGDAATNLKIACSDAAGRYCRDNRIGSNSENCVVTQDNAGFFEVRYEDSGSVPVQTMLKNTDYKTAIDRASPPLP